jgi:DNA-binding NtrC family response regulator
LAAGEVELPATDWILIVDDEFDIISIFKQALMKKGFHVFGFTDPLLAVSVQINAKRYELVISDLRMPGMNGYEFVKKVNEIKPEIKIFLMTAFEINDVEFKKLLPKVKIEGILQKPFSLADLVNTVSKYISSK